MRPSQKPTAETIFTFPTIEEVLAAEGGSTYINFEYEVYGFWSQPLNFTLDRKYHNNQWEVSMGHSSGGRDMKQVNCDIQAHQNFAIAMQHAVFHAKNALNQQARFEQAYKLRTEMLIAEAAKADEERQQKLASTPAFGTAKAKELVELVKQKKHWQAVEFSGNDRLSGSKTCRYLSFAGSRWVWRNGRGRYADRISEKAAIEHIASWTDGTVSVTE